MSKRKNAQKSRKYSVRNRTVKATKKYKDTIFRMLFEKQGKSVVALQRNEP